MAAGNYGNSGSLVRQIALAVMLIPTTGAVLCGPAAHAEQRFETWPLLTPEFASTGGGGVIIKGYEPVITAGKCVTPFTAHTPDGAVYANIVEFETEATQGGVLCKNGKWRSVDGQATGTTPLRVFIKDGVRRRSP